jgi:hypothetical protein
MIFRQPKNCEKTYRVLWVAGSRLPALFPMM